MENLPLIFRENGSHARNFNSEALRQKIITSYEVTGREALHELVANGLGIGFVSHAEIGQDPRLINLDIDTGKAEMTETLMYLTARKRFRNRAFLKARKTLIHPNFMLGAD